MIDREFRINCIIIFYYIFILIMTYIDTSKLYVKIMFIIWLTYTFDIFDILKFFLMKIKETINDKRFKIR